MRDQDILEYINKKRNVSFAIIYKKFDVETPQQKKDVKTIIQQLQDQGNISIDPKSNRIVASSDTQGASRNSAPRFNNSRTGAPKKTFGKDDRPMVRYTDDPEQDLVLIKDKFQIPGDFIPAIGQEIVNKIWDNQESIEKHREDLRDLFVITIDGADSKDLDDAVSVSKSLFGAWELGVHIADVSHYVPQQSALDVEALARANSYYFINKVTPMLPQELSNDLCSLNPHAEKKAMSVFITFDNQGNVKKYRFLPSVIKTNHRMTYDRVEEMMKGDSDKDATLVKNINLMSKLFRILHTKRMGNGSVDFNFKEKKIVLDEHQLPTKIYQKDRQDSERLIEEFMLAANQAAGDFLTNNGLGLYRVHDIPPSEKYQKLKNFAAKRGYKLPDVPKPKDLQLFIDSLIDSPVQMSGEILTLRSMAQAVYQQENIGHFGLGFTLYSHFTSPIRRYADLVVHRLIKYYLFKNEFKNPPYKTEELDKIAAHISAQERVAMEAERDLFKIKSVRYMKPLEGETINGTISSVASFGLFVEDPATGVEAMIRFSEMKDYITFNEEELIASNRSKTKVFKIGMPLTIRIVKVNIERGFIDAEEVL